MVNMKVHRILFNLIGFFVSIEFSIVLIVIVSGYFFFPLFSRLGWKLLNEKEFVRYLALVPIGALAYVAKTGRDLWLPKGEKMPSQIREWKDYMLIHDFVMIAGLWAIINVLISTPVLFLPTWIHSGRFFCIAIGSPVLAIYQLANLYRNEIKIKELLT